MTVWHRLAKRLVLILVLVSSGCGDGLAPPEVVSFSSPQVDGAGAGAGTTITLVAEFNGGTGAIDQGVGEVRSGVPVEVTLGATTTFTLTVTNADGVAVSVPLQVPVVFRVEWNLDGPDPAWILKTENGGRAVYAQGSLQLAGGDREVIDEDGLVRYVCAGGRARLNLADPALTESRFGTLTVSLRGLSAIATGLNLPSVSIRYADRVYGTYIENETELDLVVDSATGRMLVYQKGVVLREDDGVAQTGPPSVELVAYGCSADLGVADLSLDALFLEAR
jgi:hypothetical protein